MCRCPAHDDRSPSLSIRVGEHALLFHCFAGCTARDVIAAVRRVRHDALDHGVGLRTSDRDGESEWLAGRARALWECASPIGGTPAALYLANRAIEISTPALRYCDRVPLGPARSAIFRPAMLTAVHEGTTLVALQRTFLDPERGRRARDLGSPRRMLGNPGRGAVRLTPAGDILGLAEGLESAISAMTLLGIPVWATLGNERLAQVAIPLSVNRLVLLADHDKAGRRAVEHARKAHALKGRTVEILWPWHGLNDWNDVHRAGGKGGGEGVRLAA